MIGKTLHMMCLCLLLVASIMLCINAGQMLNSGYEPLEFTVVNIYTNHETGQREVTIHAEYHDTLIIPDNVLETKWGYNVVDMFDVWYNADTNLVYPHFFTVVFMKFAAAVIAIVCVAMTWPRKSKAST